MRTYDINLILFLTIKISHTGKALARSGELLIDLTSKLDLYGGSLSAMGANVRNCGDCLAQAAASCRFKTAAELVTDELREGKFMCIYVTWNINKVCAFSFLYAIFMQKSHLNANKLL